jgi:glycine betaine/choline ABC-type transport system substrate-binding protein
MCEALSGGEVDVICAFATDGRIAAYGLRVLQDDQNLFPPYDACVIVRQDALEGYDGLREALDTIGGKITPKQMRQMNHAVTEQAQAPSEVAGMFLSDNAMLPAAE